MNEIRDSDERSLFVSWRDPTVGSTHPIGRLVRRIGPLGERFSFAYLELAERLTGFTPLPGLPSLHERYDSDQAVPRFRQPDHAPQPTRL